jgi:hypothetical protein
MPPPAAQALSPSSRTASRIAGVPAACGLVILWIALTLGMWFWSVCIALVAFTLVRRHGEAHGH